MEPKLKILFFFFGLNLMSCTKYEDLSKTYNLPQNVSFSSFDSLIAFQENKEYLITLKDNSEFYFLVDKKSKEGISGYISKRTPTLEFPKESYYEIKFQQIGHAKVRVIDALKTSEFVALIAGILILSIVFLIIVNAKPANESDKYWMF